MSGAAASERRVVWYSGYVQGVGFRYQTHQIAAQFDVVGYVRNLPNGQVELVAEGTGSELDQFLQRVSETLARHIWHIDTQRQAATGEFTAFDVRR